MTAGAFSHQSNTTIARRPASDVLVEKVALRLLAWSDRRAVKNQLSHERMALILENQRSSSRGGSPLGR
ncbi:MAG: hypothetical protein JWR83_1052 [Aeromicrobium sp.]|nr:hypothetical protein [Aeromicrobium sp.]